MKAQAAKLESRKRRQPMPCIVPIEKDCQLCDMSKATKFRIPACKRPARWAVFPDMLTGVLFVCDYHQRKIIRERDAREGS